MKLSKTKRKAMFDQPQLSKQAIKEIKYLSGGHPGRKRKNVFVERTRCGVVV